MSGFLTTALRVVLAASLAGSLFLQTVMVPFVVRDTDGAATDVLAVRTPVLTVVVLVIVTTQVVMVCLWRLVGMVRTGTVFSPAAFRYVNVIIGAIAVASALTFALGVVLAPGEAAPPGVVLLVGCAGGVIGGIALLVLVMRLLLEQATAFRTELDQVI